MNFWLLKVFVLFLTVTNSKETRVEQNEFLDYGHGFDNETAELEHEKRERMSDFPDYRDKYTRVHSKSEKGYAVVFI